MPGAVGCPRASPFGARRKGHSAEVPSGFEMGLALASFPDQLLARLPIEDRDLWLTLGEGFARLVTCVLAEPPIDALANRMSRHSSNLDVKIMECEALEDFLAEDEICAAAVLVDSWMSGEDGDALRVWELSRAARFVHVHHRAKGEETKVRLAEFRATILGMLAEEAATEARAIANETALRVPPHERRHWETKLIAAPGEAMGAVAAMIPNVSDEVRGSIEKHWVEVRDIGGGWSGRFYVAGEFADPAACTRHLVGLARWLEHGVSDDVERVLLAWNVVETVAFCCNLGSWTGGSAGRIAIALDVTISRYPRLIRDPRIRTALLRALSEAEHQAERWTNACLLGALRTALRALTGWEIAHLVAVQAFPDPGTLPAPRQHPVPVQIEERKLGATEVLLACLRECRDMLKPAESRAGSKGNLVVDDGHFVTCPKRAWYFEWGKGDVDQRLKQPSNAVLLALREHLEREGWEQVGVREFAKRRYFPTTLQRSEASSADAE